MDGVDDVAFLAGSEPRGALLAALADDGGLTKDELVDRCEAARVTVTRNLDQLAERGYVAETEGRYRLTSLGSFLAGDFLSLVETAGVADHLAPLLSRLSADELDLDPRILADAEVTVSTDAHPYAPADRHSEAFETASRARLLLPEVGAREMDAAADRVLSGALELEFVVDPDVAETLRTALADRFGRLQARDNVAAYVHEAEVPCFIGLVDGTVQLGVSDDDGIPRALAESDAEAARAWAEATYESFRAAAEPLGAVG